MSTAADARVEVVGRLDATGVEVVTRLVEDVTEHDGVAPLSEHATLHLRSGGDVPGRHVLLHGPDGGLVGYGFLDVTDPVEGASAEVAVHPAHRGRGYGRALVARLLAEAGDGPLRLWAHGGLPAAAALAQAMGFQRVRSLLQMRRSLDGELPQPRLPAGVTVRTFRPGVDDEEWLEVNRRAFAAHPEQGLWSLDDLRRRLVEPWFDPAGFFLAERDGRVVGFHWTKVHGGSDPSPTGSGAAHSHGHEPLGEVYVVGVDPAAQGAGLGRALTLVGLTHLRSRGLPQAMLYVEADNAPAIAVYSALGFTPWDTDVMFRR